MNNKTKHIAAMGVTVAVAMVLSFVESRFPLSIAIPGIKIGIANIAVIFALYRLGVPSAALVSFLRVILVSVSFGSSVSFLYSVSGAALSFIIMCVLKKLTPLTEIGVSVVGGVAHNIGQIIMASIIMKTNVITYYLPFLLLSGTVAGTAIGVISALLVKRIRLI